MSSLPLFGTDLLALGYPATFGFTALVCFAGITRATAIQRPAIRRGMVWLLVTTGCWGLFKLAYFLLPFRIKEYAYLAGLVFGFSTVWIWLYFASAYAGREYHQNQTLRRTGIAVFLGVVLVKLTNPIHHRYFTTEEMREPFHYLAIEHGTFHWLVTGLSYVLAGIGLFLLFEAYYESGYDTRPLMGLTVLLGLPVGLDTVAYLHPGLIDVIYAPLGVAAFVLGTLFVYERRFLAVQSTAGGEDPAVVLDETDEIRDLTPPAVELFPELERGEPLEKLLPAVTAQIEDEAQTVEYEQDGEVRYYFVSTSSVQLGESRGRIVLFSDVTATEKRRRELDRHNTQLEGFADALAHELRNMLQIIDWRLTVATEEVDETSLTHESIDIALEANDRLADRIDDFTTLARYGQTIEQLDTLSLPDTAVDAWERADTGDMEIEIETGCTLRADPGPLRELLINAFEFARLNDADTVRIDHHQTGFSITDDGEPPRGDPDEYLAFGESVPDAESGMKLPNVQTFARVHDWDVALDTDYEDGVRLLVSGVTIDRHRNE